MVMLSTALLICGIFLVVNPVFSSKDESTVSDWVVRVPRGLEAAHNVAFQQGLTNFGEVLPGSNLFHFSASQGDQKTRKRRAAKPVEHNLVEHKDVDYFLAQPALKRVKRIPVEPRTKRQADKARSTGQKLCFINTIATGEKESRRCIFPFSFRGKTYLECTVDHSGNGKEWCATQVDSEGVVITHQWGDCDKSSLSCLTIGAGSIGKDAPQRQRPRLPPPPRERLPPLPPQRPRGPPPQLPRQRPDIPPFLPRQPLQGRPQGFPPGLQQQQGPPPFRSFPQPGGSNRLPLAPHRGPPGNGGSLPPQFLDPQFLLSLANQLSGKNSPIVKDILEEEDGTTANFSAFKTLLNDPVWPKMWYLNRGGRGLDMNVETAWALGASGKGVVVTILDDGVEWNHPDLAENYDPEASTDLNDEDRDPFPRYDFINSNKHGTRCAGTVAALANNSQCAVGVAFNAKVGGVRILDGNILDVLEARALSFNRDHIDIYSASWGPDDNGKTVDGPGPLARTALREGVTKGRQGKGSIFVWASGNGGKALDNCNCDGYTTSIYTLSVSSVSETGRIPWYSEPCSSSLATTYSSGSSKRLKERKVVTTDLHGKCTTQHTGTSASSPMAAGIVALTLEVNPDLSWRDIQHIVVRTAIPKGHMQARDWARNGVGLEFSHSYGFGLMDAGSMVKLAKQWVPVPESVNCTTAPGQSGVDRNNPKLIRPNTEELIPLDASSCEDVRFLEHIHVHIRLTSGARRGDLSVLLRSPDGTVSILLAPRPLDDIRTGFNLFSTWPMMSVHFWGEPVKHTDGNGNWVLLVRNDGDKPAILTDWQITFYGTNVDPQPGVPIRPTFSSDEEPGVDQQEELPEPDVPDIPEYTEVADDADLDEEEPEEVASIGNENETTIDPELVTVQDPREQVGDELLGILNDRVEIEVPVLLEE